MSSISPPTRAASDVTSLNSRIKTFHKAPGDQIGEYKLDANDSFVITVELGNGALGPIQATRWATGNLNDIRLGLFGDKGALRVMTDGKLSTLSICAGEDVDAATWREVECPPVPSNYQRFAAAVRTGVNGDPDFRRGAALQQILDLSFAANELGTLKVE